MSRLRYFGCATFAALLLFGLGFSLAQTFTGWAYWGMVCLPPAIVFVCLILPCILLSVLLSDRPAPLPLRLLLALIVLCLGIAVTLALMGSAYGEFLHNKEGSAIVIEVFHLHVLRIPFSEVSPGTTGSVFGFMFLAIAFGVLAVTVLLVWNLAKPRRFKASKEGS